MSAAEYDVVVIGAGLVGVRLLETACSDTLTTTPSTRQLVTSDR